jgi:hypothetical protein
MDFASHTHSPKPFSLLVNALSGLFIAHGQPLGKRELPDKVMRDTVDPFD